MENNYNIGIFDSGVGGITVLKEILKILPNENIIYYGDSANAPYGEKSASKIQKLSLKIMDFFLANKCKIVVIACNTATAASLNFLKERFSIPIIGVISAGARLALETTKNKKINLLATPFTVKSNSYTDALTTIDPNIFLFQEGCPEICPMIERGWESFKNREDILFSHIKKLNSEADTLILACTHYPLIKNDISKFFRGTIIDPSKETALELYNFLNKNNLLNSQENKGKLEFFVTGDKKRFIDVAEKFLEFKINNVYLIKV